MGKRPKFLGKKIVSIVDDGRKSCTVVKKESEIYEIEMVCKFDIVKELKIEPAVVHCSVVKQDVLKEENADMAEYVVVETIDSNTLSRSDMYSNIFKDFFKAFGTKNSWKIGDVISKEQRIYGFTDELLRICFIKEKACDLIKDPEVNLGDKFENHEGTCMAVNSFKDHIHLVLIEKAEVFPLNVHLGMSEGDNAPCPCFLSDLIGKVLLKDFKKI